MQVAVVTGGNTGIGKATAVALSERGYSVIVLHQTNNLSIMKKIHGLAIKTDITKEKEIVQACKKIKKKFGRVDVLVNNAGVHYNKQVGKMTMTDWEKTLHVNVIGTSLVTKHVKKLMRKGSIVNVASIRGIQGSDKNMQYSASKAAIINMTQSLAKAYAPSIRVNSVSPGLTKTDMTKGQHIKNLKTIKHTLLQRMAKPEEIAKSIVFLASDDASFITGQNVIVDGGWSLG